MYKIKIESLTPWGSSDRGIIIHPPLSRESGISPRHTASPFKVSHNINSRLILWGGDITRLAVDAITNTTNENFSESNFISDRILAVAGPKLRAELKNRVRECCIGECKVTKGFNLPAKYIIHTVGPYYRHKYKSASENTLNTCYRNILNKAKELKLKTIALCNISTPHRHFPTDLEAHIVLRTVRRFLEKTRKEIVILCVDPHEETIYEVLVPLYYPRTALEEDTARWQLPRDIGGEFGEANHPDRKIRIIRNPQHVMGHPDDDSDISPHDMEECSDFNAIHLNAFQTPERNSYAQIQPADLDRQLLLGDRQRSGVYESVIEEGLEGIEHQEIYERYLRRAQVEDLNEVSGIGCLYQSGVDRLGRPVIVFCGKWFPANNLDLEKAMLYLIKLLDPIVKSDYVIAYFHTLTTTNNYPSLHWLREVYTVLPYKYKKNLKAFYIVHPTFWTKMMTWWFTTFMAPAIKAKVHSLPGVEHLYSAISKDQLEIPAYITEYDMSVNGLHYFTPSLTPS